MGSRWVIQADASTGGEVFVNTAYEESKTSDIISQFPRSVSRDFADDFDRDLSHYSRIAFRLNYADGRQIWTVECDQGEETREGMMHPDDGAHLLSELRSRVYNADE